MKRLYLLRHAKSSWNEPDLADFDRPLNERGLIAAPFMGRFIVTKDYLPDIIISSPARRAFATAKLVLESSGADAELVIDDRVYEASPRTLMEVTASVSETANSAMLVGHNPGIEGFIRILTGRGEAMPTAALAAIDLAVDRWADIRDGCGTLIEVVRPKEHIPA
jgi:phosphohistidine phosphatase